jgi:hypothetical protein
VAGADEAVLVVPCVALQVVEAEEVEVLTVVIETRTMASYRCTAAILAAAS